MLSCPEDPPFLRHLPSGACGANASQSSLSPPLGNVGIITISSRRHHSLCSMVLLKSRQVFKAGESLVARSDAGGLPALGRHGKRVLVGKNYVEHDSSKFHLFGSILSRNPSGKRIERQGTKSARSEPQPHRRLCAPVSPTVL